MDELPVPDWVRHAVAEARSSRYAFATIHVDRLDLPGGISAGIAAASLIDRATSEMRDVGATGAVRLAVPIGVSVQLDTAPPRDVVWPSVMDEPPSLYYFEPRFWLKPSDREEYRCPCDLAELSGLGLSAEYVCGRSMIERTHDWEFSKTLWLYPVSGAEIVGEAF